MSIDDSNISVDLTIYREYILHLPIEFNEIKAKFQKIDFILGFASEDYNIQGKGTGYFKPTWNVDDLSPEKLKTLKENNPQVRVILSIGGVGTEYPFNPIEKHQWISNALNSIRQIIIQYDRIYRYHNIIDGIDIHYDVIKSSRNEFSYLIGDVIKQLKNDTRLFINVVSIAPTAHVQSYYHKLYSDHKDIIDLVDYQFYNQKIYSKDEFVELYKNLVGAYGSYKVLPGYSNPYDPIIIEGIIYLIKNKLIPGIFYWNPNNSTIDTNTSSLENILQNL